MKKTAAVVNLGCPKNQVDSEIISGLLGTQFDMTDDPASAHVIIVNTCGFIEEAKAESIDALCEMINYKNNCRCEKVYAVGCLAQRYGKDLFKELPELDGVLGDGDLDKILNDVAGTEERVFRNKKHQDFLYSHDMPRLRMSPPYFAYVKIADGCDNCCSYCAIPQIKGKYRSRSMESITEEVKRLADEGVKEIALIAQDTTRYGLDLYGRIRLPELIRGLAAIDGIQWIRLMYCYPEAFSQELIDLIAGEPKLCKYVDLPLQHGDNDILACMNRRNTAEEAEDLIAKLREAIPYIFIRSSFITGFPGETEEQFNNLLNFVQRIKLDRIGVFAYSQEEGTPAGRMKNQLPLEVRESRKERLMAAQAGIAESIQQKRIGQVIRVILEEETAPEQWTGRTEGDAPEIDGQIYLKVFGKHTAGDILQTTITKADSYDMGGESLE
ncbi:30S ribosomal protein S12 methylthiotransferase RimO [Dehalobacter sp. DCM]|uniref:30S ribosomal protein S12 methylthiotransferase RimO n=1 Tax=Dehalobacter sp. DCM TaxID=2907827 RepID=UPI003081B7B9|nr:30S ribosomal protein S12 methylthiotransferase RimO [Dehalobacter sp. DCM]